MNGAENFIEVGQIIRPQGLKGEVKAVFSELNPDEINKLALVYLKNSRGDFYPVRINSVRPENSTNAHSFFVQFEHVVDRSGAEDLTHSVVYVDPEMIEKHEKPVSPKETRITDFSVFDKNDNEIGFVLDVLETPAHPVIIIQKDSGQLMVPAVEEFILKVDTDEKKVFCHNLDQFDGV